MAEQIIGGYKIEDGFLPGECLVRKALGPWPLSNWSWISFYDGTAEQCREYIRWAKRVDAGDKALISHASDWLQGKIRRPEESLDPSWTCKCVEHLPKTWRYDFRVALALHPPAPAPETEVSGGALLLIVGVIVALICGFLYHSV